MDSECRCVQCPHGQGTQQTGRRDGRNERQAPGGHPSTARSDSDRGTQNTRQRYPNSPRRLADAEGQEVTDENFEQYAQVIRDLRISHESGHAVLAEHFGYELKNLGLDAVIVSPDEGASGGSAEINFRIFPNRPDLHEQLQNIATVLMGGIAAEELTHPHLAKEQHGKNDVSQYEEFAKRFKLETATTKILDEGFNRAKMLLSGSNLKVQHDRLRQFLEMNPVPQQPNGRFLRRVMKGLSS